MGSPSTIFEIRLDLTTHPKEKIAELKTGLLKDKLTEKITFLEWDTTPLPKKKGVRFSRGGFSSDDEHHFILFSTETAAKTKMWWSLDKLKEGIVLQCAPKYKVVKTQVFGKDRGASVNIFEIDDFPLLTDVDATDQKSVEKLLNWLQRDMSKFLQDSDSYDLAETCWNNFAGSVRLSKGNVEGDEQMFKYDMWCSNQKF